MQKGRGAEGSRHSNLQFGFDDQMMVEGTSYRSLTVHSNHLFCLSMGLGEAIGKKKPRNVSNTSAFWKDVSLSKEVFWAGLSYSLRRDN